jgi:hypothetical protein
MEHQLHHGYTIQGMVHAVNICRFPKDHRPRLRAMALRYIFMYRKSCDIVKLVPTMEKLVQISITMFEDLLLDRNREVMNEIADILHEYGPGTYGLILLERIRNLDVEAVPTRDIARPLAQTIKKTVYADSQNVHNSKINQSVIKVLTYLYNKFKETINLKGVSSTENTTFKNGCVQNIGDILIAKYPSKKNLINKSIDYIRNSIAMFGNTSDLISLKDAFIALWFWISSDKHKDELESRLLEELKEMNGQCTTGHIARLMNVIQGFTQDENLCIRISDEEQCNAVIRNYLTSELSKCTDDKVLEGMVEGTEDYIKFIRRKIADKLLSWQKEYGKDILNHVATVTNDFAKVTVFVI